MLNILKTLIPAVVTKVENREVTITLQAITKQLFHGQEWLGRAHLLAIKNKVFRLKTPMKYLSMVM